MRHEAIYALYPSVVSIDDAMGAFDAEGNKVTIDESGVTVKANELRHGGNQEQDHLARK